MEQSKIVEEIGKQAIAVAASADQVEAARAKRRAASADLLNRVIDVVKPALRVICRRVEISRTRSKLGETSQSAGFRGLELWGWAPSGMPVDDKRREFYERQVGATAAGVILTDHGDLVLARYEYFKTDEATTWRATFDLMTAARVVDQVGGDLSGLLDRIASALRDAATESGPGRAAELLTQAARIAAAAVLLAAP